MTLFLSSEAEVLSADCMSATSCHPRARLFAKALFPGKDAPRPLNVQQQQEAKDCGLFAIAFTEAFCRGEDLEQITFDETKMREHLLLAFLKKTPTLTAFPTVAL